MEPRLDSQLPPQKPEVFTSSTPPNTSPPIVTQDNSSSSQDPGYIWALIGLITSFVGPALVGLILCIIGYTKSKNAGYKNTLAIVGIVISAGIIFLAVLFITWLMIAW